jgi:hypothetical protein
MMLRVADSTKAKYITYHTYYVRFATSATAYYHYISLLSLQSRCRKPRTRILLLYYYRVIIYLLIGYTWGGNWQSYRVYLLHLYNNVTTRRFAHTRRNARHYTLLQQSDVSLTHVHRRN